jgi:exodeoxyribonuclease VII large subunit
MSRLPFPAPGPAPDPASKPPSVSQDPVITVSQLAARIDGALKAGIPMPVRFVGEVSGFRDRTHWYFDLKDANAVVSCVMFQSAAKRVGFVPNNGQQVVCRGLVEFYAKSGKVSVILDSMEPVGAGALELAYRALVAELKGLGWFDAERKAPLPVFPRRVAVVTSKTGAALQDVLVTMKRRCPAVGVLVVDVRVQGAKAAPEVADAISYLDSNADALGIDAILLTRGGGSMEDLWAFNERSVAQAIFDCRVPIVAAIGHETDTTIAELVADERCATPTQAAVRLTPDTAALLQQVDSHAGRLAGQLQRMIRFDVQRVVGFARQPLFTNPRGLVVRAGEQLAGSGALLKGSLDKRVTASRHRLEQAAARLEGNRPSAVYARLVGRLNLAESRLKSVATTKARESGARLAAIEKQLASVGPVHVLERGFSVTLGSDGRVVRSPGQVKAGDTIQTRVAAGSFASTVSDGSARRATKGAKAKGAQGPSLFESEAFRDPENRSDV